VRERGLLLEEWTGSRGDSAGGPLYIDICIVRSLDWSGSTLPGRLLISKTPHQPVRRASLENMPIYIYLLHLLPCTFCAGHGAIHSSSTANRLNCPPGSVYHQRAIPPLQMVRCIRQFRL